MFYYVLLYVVWEEKDVVPIFVLEIVSQTPGGEYHEKMLSYAQLEVLYYLIYNPHSAPSTVTWTEGVQGER
ncbi:MAG: hypothetical protein F6K36_28265 [Symploca sp. SIO3C6]|nr:hypothetical protein [Symploca sp. SIO3C6]